MLDDPRLPERFWSKVTPEPMTGCWLWMAAGTRTGYGQFGYLGKYMYAHRVAYMTLVGPIPDGLTIDHLCRVRCCPRGHAYSADNTLHRSYGGRVCRACNSQRNRDWYARNREAQRARKRVPDPS